jgi:hypothetical protein
MDSVLSSDTSDVFPTSERFQYVCIHQIGERRFKLLQALGYWCVKRFTTSGSHVPPDCAKAHKILRDAGLLNYSVAVS